MAQHDYDIANADGATVRADLNSLFEAIATANSGATAPSTTFAYQPWFDTANNLLKMRNGANNAWVTVASLSGTTWIPYRSGTALGTAAILTSGTASANLPTVSDIENTLLPTVSQVDAEAGTATDRRAWTAQRVAQAIAALGGGRMARGGQLDLSSGTGGTITDFGGVTDPDMIDVALFGVTMDATNDLLAQLGDSGGVETTGYESASGHGVSGGQFSTSTAGMVVFGPASAKFNGVIQFRRVDGNIWSASHSIMCTTGGIIAAGGGSKTLSATCDRLAIAASASANFNGAGALAQLWAGKAA